MGVAVIKEPMNVYFIVQFVLIFIYLPLANRRVHGLLSSGLRRMVSKGALAVTLSLAKDIVLYVLFLALSVMIVELSKTNYRVHEIPLKAPEISEGVINEPIATNVTLKEPRSSKPISDNRRGTSRRLPSVGKSNARYVVLKPQKSMDGKTEIASIGNQQILNEDSPNKIKTVGESLSRTFDNIAKNVK